MDLGEELCVVDLDDLVEVGYRLEVLPVPLGRLQGRVVLEAADHVEYRVLREHELEEGVLVQEEDILEDLVQVVQSLGVLEVLGHLEHVEQLLDVAFPLDGHGQLFAPNGRREARGHLNNKFPMNSSVRASNHHRIVGQL